MRCRPGATAWPSGPAPKWSERSALGALPQRQAALGFAGVRGRECQGCPRCGTQGIGQRVQRGLGAFQQFKFQLQQSLGPFGAGHMDAALIQRDFAAAFSQVDVLISPTAPTTAWELGAKLADPLAMWLSDITTIPVNMAGIPGISIPIGLADEDNLPVGLQIMAPAREDARLYEVGAAIEALLDAQRGGAFSTLTPNYVGGGK